MTTQTKLHSPHLSHNEALLLSCLVHGNAVKAANVRHKFALLGVRLSVNTFCVIGRRAADRGVITRKGGRYQITERGREALRRSMAWYREVDARAGVDL